MFIDFCGSGNDCSLLDCILSSIPIAGGTEDIGTMFNFSSDDSDSNTSSESSQPDTNI